MLDSQLSHPLESSKKLVNVDKQQVYSQFKNNEGQQYSSAITKNFLELQELRKEIKVIVEKAQALKQEIDFSKEKLDKKQDFKN